MCGLAAFSLSMADLGILSTLLHNRLQLVWSQWSSEPNSCCRTTIGNWQRRANNVVYVQLPAEMLSALSCLSYTPVWWRQLTWKTRKSGFSGCWMETKQRVVRRLWRFWSSYRPFIIIHIRDLCHCTIISCVGERTNNTRFKTSALPHIRRMSTCCSKTIETRIHGSVDETSIHMCDDLGCDKNLINSK